MMLLIGLVQAAAYYLSIATVQEEGLAIPQVDTLLYCQSARRIAEGGAFTYSSGAIPSTGTTSVIYPFILAVPYCLGLTGNSLIFAAFVLNSLFYLVFLAFWGMIVDVKLRHPIARLSAAVIIALFGQTAFSAFSLLDMGLWMAVSAMFAAGLATGRRWLYGLILVVSPWVRPEGLILSLAFMCGLSAVLLLQSVFHRRFSITADLSDWIILLLAVASVIGVAFLNYQLTESVGYSSLAHKGYFKGDSVLMALYSTAGDLLKLVKSLILGLPNGVPRDFYFIPVVGSALGWLWIVFRNWKRESSWLEFVWVVAMCGGFLSVAQSGWESINFDRYLGWLMPTLIIAMAGGLGVVVKKNKVGGYILSCSCLIFSFAMAAVHLVVFSAAVRDANHLREFAAQCEDAVPRGASVGCWGDCGFAYEMSARKICHLSGIYSVEYLTKNFPSGVLEILKNEPDKRFDFWFHNSLSTGDYGINLGVSIADQVLVGPCGYELLKAKWDRFDASAEVPNPASNVALCARVDVGYQKDEDAAEYHVTPTYDVSPQKCFLVQEKKGTVDLIDAGRIVTGGDEMTVALSPGKDVHVVMRTLPEWSFVLSHGNESKPYRYAFANPLKLIVTVDGEIATRCELSYAEKGFSDVGFAIPGAAIKQNRSRIGIWGDHITCGYWFYQ